jgi:hypothetical protein
MTRLTGQWQGQPALPACKTKLALLGYSLGPFELGRTRYMRDTEDQLAWAVEDPAGRRPDPTMRLGLLGLSAVNGLASLTA